MADDLDDVPALDGAEDPRDVLTALDSMLAYLKDKVAMPAEEFYALSDEAKQRAFTVSGVADLDMVSDVWTAIERAVESGETLEDFRARVSDGLTEAWGGEKPWRVELIFRNGVQSAYSAGRQTENAAVAETHPYIHFAVVDDLDTSEICQELIGVVVRADSDFAATHHVPLHHGCRTDEIAITEDEAREYGVVEDHEAPDVEADDGFGGALEQWVPDLSSRPPELAAIYEQKLLG